VQVSLLHLQECPHLTVILIKLESLKYILTEVRVFEGPLLQFSHKVNHDEGQGQMLHFEKTNCLHQQDIGICVTISGCEIRAHVVLHVKYFSSNIGGTGE
jgi:hypothetical protein